MINIREKQAKQIEQTSFKKLSNKIKNWLRENSKAHQEKDLSFLMSEAKYSRMLTETDYALFICICIEQPMPPEEFLQRTDIQTLLNNPKINPAGKLARMEQLAKHPPTDQ